jgi:hypothetical protein
MRKISNAVIRSGLAVLILAVVSLLGVARVAADESKSGPSTELKFEYLMTYVALLDPPVTVDNSMAVVNLKPGGWVKGPKISGSFIQPSADWVRAMPSGVLRLDARGVIKTDDNQVIYATYSGTLQHSRESFDKMNRGELLTTKDVPYFIAVPIFQTSSEKYSWLNGVQAISKMVELKIGEGGYAKYDVFIVR